MTELPASKDATVQHAVPAQLLHDLRTPVGHIMGYAELLIEEMNAAGHEEFIPHLEKIRTASQQLVGLIKDNFQAQ
ncbi:MAG: histidine kinase dimerization/phospho-acceptor domain-containing protein [Gemmatimonadaceae bacterium]